MSLIGSVRQRNILSEFLQIVESMFILKLYLRLHGKQ
jgi:hypothetical protein